MLHSGVEAFAELTGIDERAHALAHLSQHAFRQIALHRLAKLRERSFFIDRQNQQQTFLALVRAPMFQSLASWREKSEIS